MSRRARIPLAATLCALFDVDRERALLAREVWKAPRGDRLAGLIAEHCPRTDTYCRNRVFSEPTAGHLRRMALDELLRTFGPEYLGAHRRDGRPVYYLNTGDTYAPTLILKGANTWVATWGDLVERNLIREEVNTHD